MHVYNNYVAIEKLLMVIRREIVFGWGTGRLEWWGQVQIYMMMK